MSHSKEKATNEIDPKMTEMVELQGIFFFFFFGGPYRDTRNKASIAILKDFFKKRKHTYNEQVRNLIRETNY